MSEKISKEKSKSMFKDAIYNLYTDRLVDDMNGYLDSISKYAKELREDNWNTHKFNQLIIVLERYRETREEFWANFDIDGDEFFRKIGIIWDKEEGAQ